MGRNGAAGALEGVGNEGKCRVVGRRNGESSGMGGRVKVKDRSAEGKGNCSSSNLNTARRSLESALFTEDIAAEYH